MKSTLSKKDSNRLKKDSSLSKKKSSLLKKKSSLLKKKSALLTAVCLSSATVLLTSCGGEKSVAKSAAVIGETTNEISETKTVEKDADKTAANETNTNEINTNETNENKTNENETNTNETNINEANENKTNESETNTNENKTNESENKTNQSQTNAKDVKPETKAKEAPAQPKTEKPDNKPAATYVTYNGNTINLNVDINSLSLGEPTDFSSAPSCNYDGMDKAFTYGGVSLYTYPDGEKDFINEIEINDASVTSSKGIAPIGKSMSDIKSVYGEPSSVEGFTYKYANGDSYTYFYAENDVVSYWGLVYEP